MSRSVFEKIFEWGSVAVGLCILGSCTAAGFHGGPLLGVAGLICGLLVALLVVGGVFLITRTSADVRAIRERLDAKPEAPGELPPC